MDGKYPKINGSGKSSKQWVITGDSPQITLLVSQCIAQFLFTAFTSQSQCFGLSYHNDCNPQLESWSYPCTWQTRHISDQRMQSSKVTRMATHHATVKALNRMAEETRQTNSASVLLTTRFVDDDSFSQCSDAIEAMETQLEAVRHETDLALRERWVRVKM